MFLTILLRLQALIYRMRTNVTPIQPICYRWPLRNAELFWTPAIRICVLNFNSPSPSNDYGSVDLGSIEFQNNDNMEPLSKQRKFDIISSIPHFNDDLNKDDPLGLDELFSSFSVPKNNLDSSDKQSMDSNKLQDQIALCSY